MLTYFVYAALFVCVYVCINIVGYRFYRYAINSFSSLWSQKLFEFENEFKCKNHLNDSIAVFDFKIQENHLRDFTMIVYRCNYLAKFCLF